MVKWVIQSNLGNMEDTEKLKATLESLRIPFELIKVIPFSDDPPDVDNSDLTIFYGSTTLTKNVHASRRWTPGVWFNYEAYEYENILAGYGKGNLLNGDSEVLSVGNFLSRNYPKDKELFVRPAADMKEFTGSVSEFGELQKQWDGLASSMGPLSFYTMIQVAQPKMILREFRTIVVDKKIVSASQYRRNGKLDVRGGVPSKATEYALQCAQLYQPAPVFVLDVCELPGGVYKIVETNTFNCAGWYWMDYFDIVKEVTAFTERTYNK